MGQEKHRFVALDGLRGVAALAVAIMHLYYAASAGRSPKLLPAALAVDFFFMLSGFVLAFAYFTPLEQGMSWFRFMRARVIRLYPLIPVGVLIGAAIALLRQHSTGVAVPGQEWFDVPIALLVLPAGLAAPRPTQNFTFDPPLWSLFFEFLASALFATRLRNMSSRGAIVFLIVAGALDVWATYVLTTTNILTTGGWLALLVNVPRTAFAFALGIAIYRSDLWRRMPTVPIFWIGLALAAVLLVPGEDGPIYNIAVLFLVMPPIVLLGAKATAREGKLCSWFGDLSYPLYVLHYPVGRAVVFALKNRVGDPLVQAAIAVVASIIVSALFLKLYDEPLRGWLTKRVKGRGPQGRPGGAPNLI